MKTEQKELRKKWVEALRSGDYKQGTRAMKSDDFYCCLGVLEDICGAEWIAGQDFFEGRYGVIDTVPNNEIAFNTLSEQTRRKVGLMTRGGDFKNEDGRAQMLAELNDNGTTFNQIADIIEMEPDGLFYYE